LSKRLHTKKEEIYHEPHKERKYLPRTTRTNTNLESGEFTTNMRVVD